jgi:hypothetical protein
MRHSVMVFVLLVIVAGQISNAQTGVPCETTSLYGRVLAFDLPDPPPAWWVVHVSANTLRDSMRPVDSVDSQRDMYCVKVPWQLRTFLTFERTGYDPQDSAVIYTGDSDKKHSWLIPVIKLTAIKTSLDTNTQTKVDITQGLRASLQRHRNSLKLSKSYDIFLWNIEIYKDLYKNNPPFMEEINKFLAEVQADPDLRELSDPENQRRAGLYAYLIASSNDKQADSNRTKDLLTLIRDVTIFPAIRAKAVENLARAEPKSSVMTLVGILQSDPDVAVRIAALQGLTEIGDPNAVSDLQRAALLDDSSEIRAAATAAAYELNQKQHNRLQLSSIPPSGERVSALVRTEPLWARHLKLNENLPDLNNPALKNQRRIDIVLDLVTPASSISLNGYAVREGRQIKLSFDFTDLRTSSAVTSREYIFWIMNADQSIHPVGSISLWTGSPLQSIKIHTIRKAFGIFVSDPINQDVKGIVRRRWCPK